ncbi:hypothetical protein FH589_00110 [Leptospira interrogans]|uniref:hypothetical protein n=1 Tax=Leptospira interrogans TaxID=173 RepID=UPI0010BFCB92|nr:hypothetical protein [Leptospira interrogans]KAA1264117.1 hypothetical protein C5473_20725 [Leptospira interrogans serovar Weerasinghe]QCO39232.1 hypothetical protein E4412_19045 [Leptospira interrogans]ULG82339.1 hypothetical protein FH595_17450 [Leptospira interrogans]UML67219.1 hypothetical protein FH589_00110 [Leptospira interrogans]UML74101.1 hypothetical protein FH598_18660 [Leptospira interrogans]
MFFRIKTSFLARFLLSFLGLGLFHTLYASKNDILEISDVLVHQTEVNRILSISVSDSLVALDQEDFLVLNSDTVVVTKSNHPSNLAHRKVSPLDLKDQRSPILIENRFLHLYGFNFGIPFFFYGSSQNFISPVTVLTKNLVSILEKTDVCLFILDRGQSFDSKNCMAVFLFQKDPFSPKLFLTFEDSLLHSIELEKKYIAHSKSCLVQDQRFWTNSRQNIVKVERLKFLPRRLEEKLSTADWKRENDPSVFWQTWGRGYNLVDRLSWKLRSDGIVLAIISEPKGLSFNVQSSSTNESTRFQSPAFQFNNFFYQNSVVG